MNRIWEILFLWGIVLVLTACGQSTAPAGNLAQDININADSLKNVRKSGDGKNGEAEAAAQENPKEDGIFSFVYEGVTLTPGEPVNHAALPKYTDVAEVPSCAFGGNDNVYNFETFELTTHIDGDEEIVYSVYFIDPNLSTTEGLCLGDNVDDMRSLYGEAYEIEENAYTYTRGLTSLIVITKNDIVVSIEYRLDR